MCVCVCVYVCVCFGRGGDVSGTSRMKGLKKKSHLIFGGNLIQFVLYIKQELDSQNNMHIWKDG